MDLSKVWRKLLTNAKFIKSSDEINQNVLSAVEQALNQISEEGEKRKKTQFQRAAQSFDRSKANEPWSNLNASGCVIQGSLGDVFALNARDSEIYDVIKFHKHGGGSASLNLEMLETSPAFRDVCKTADEVGAYVQAIAVSVLRGSARRNGTGTVHVVLNMKNNIL